VLLMAGLLGPATAGLATGQAPLRTAPAKVAPSGPAGYAARPEVAAFAADMAGRGLDAEWVMQVLGRARTLEAVRAAIRPLPAGQRKNWQTYRARFVEADRIQAGIEFLRLHAATLTRASQQFGVPVEVILGIVGVETFFGRNTGRYPVLDALATLAFDYPTVEGRDRSAFFREQLAQFLLWCRTEQCEPTAVRGSYAGAIGLPQFIPENIYRYGTDFDGDGRINLLEAADAIGSIARFLALHGWVRALVPTAAVDLATAQLPTLLEPDIVPSFTPMQLVALGAKPLSPVSAWERYAVVELQNGEADSEYVLGSRNFYVLTRYNRSAYYAMAVLELGRQVMSGTDLEKLAGSAMPGATPPLP
jgi:membrane-bound lytic murein transglycosylase B